MRPTFSRNAGLALIATVAGACTDVDDLALDDSAILQGTPVAVGEQPAVVAIVVGPGEAGQSGHHCAGALVAPSWILTTAICVDPSFLKLPDQAAVLANLDVVFDDVALFDGVQEGRRAKAARIVVHPDFHLGALAHDMALVQLAQPVTDRAPLVPSRGVWPPGTTFTRLGFGSGQKGDDPQSGVLRQVISNSVDCTPWGVPETIKYCFAAVDGQAACNGDTGGPGIVTEFGQPRLASLISGGDPECQRAIDTRVDAELAFIDEHLAEPLPPDAGLPPDEGSPGIEDATEAGCGCTLARRPSDTSPVGSFCLLLAIAVGGVARRRIGRRHASARLAVERAGGADRP